MPSMRVFARVLAIRRTPCRAFDTLHLLADLLAEATEVPLILSLGAVPVNRCDLRFPIVAQGVRLPYMPVRPGELCRTCLPGPEKALRARPAMFVAGLRAGSHSLVTASGAVSRLLFEGFACRRRERRKLRTRRELCPNGRRSWPLLLRRLAAPESNSPSYTARSAQVCSQNSLRARALSGALVSGQRRGPRALGARRRARRERHGGRRRRSSLLAAACPRSNLDCKRKWIALQFTRSIACEKCAGVEMQTGDPIAVPAQL